jgi:hypothetical protein
VVAVVCVCVLVLGQGVYAYCAAEDGCVYCFNLHKGDIEDFVKASRKRPIGGGPKSSALCS